MSINEPTIQESLREILRRLDDMKAYGVRPSAGDVTAPSVPTGLLADENLAGLVRILWDASTDNIAVAVYQVYRDGVPLGSAATPIYADNTVAPQAVYSYQVQAVDGDGNASALSAALVVTTPANEPPVWDSAAAAQNLTEGQSFELSLNEACDDPDFQPLTYSHVSGAFPENVALNVALKKISGVPAPGSAGEYTVTIGASDGYVTVNQAFTLTVAAASDATAPSAPASLTVGTITQSSIALSWNASTDASGIDHYNIYREIPESPGFTLRGTSLTTSFTDTNMGSGVPRNYRVTAVDASPNANESAPSNTVSATTLAATDTSAPTVPTNLAASAASSSQINLGWTASTDNVAVAGYKVYFATSLNGTYSLLATLGNVTSYQNSGLAPSTTRFYKVSAFDTASPANESAQSSAVSATTNAVSGVFKKWNPGHYLKVQHQHGDANWVTTSLNALTKVEDSPLIKGGMVIVAWGRVNPTGSTFDFSGITQILNYLRPRNKRLILAISYKLFNVSSSTGLMPADLASGNVYANGNNGFTAAVWRETVMNRLIACYTAMGNAFDSDPNVEIITCDESAPSWGASPSPSDYSNTALGTQLKRMYTGMAAAWPTTNALANINSLASNQASELIEHAYQVRMGRSSPDAMPNLAAYLFRGEAARLYQTNALSSGQGSPVRDYRGQVPHLGQGSNPVLGGKDEYPWPLFYPWSYSSPDANFGVDAVIDWCKDNKATHMSWVPSGGLSTHGTGANYSWANVLAGIAADPLIHMTLPTRYDGAL